jgi:hypothetical protein
MMVAANCTSAVSLIAQCFPSSWRIAAVEGVRYEGALDDTAVLLRRTAAHESGAIRFTYTTASNESGQRWGDPAPLHFVETREGEESIAEHLRPFGRPCH